MVTLNVKPSHPVKPWGFSDFFMGSGYPTHNLEGLVPHPEFLTLPSMPPPTERTVEDQPFCRVHKHLDVPHELIDVTSGSFSLHAYKLKEHEAVARKTAAAFSNALSIAEYVYNQPELSEESRLGLHQIKLDIVAGANYAWRSVHNHMLIRHSVVTDNLSKTVPPIDPDRVVALLHASFRGTTLSRGELSKVYRANKERTNSLFTQQLPLSLTPQSLIQAVLDSSGRVAPATGEVHSYSTLQFCYK